LWKTELTLLAIGCDQLLLFFWSPCVTVLSDTSASSLFSLTISKCAEIELCTLNGKLGAVTWFRYAKAAVLARSTIPGTGDRNPQAEIHVHKTTYVEGKVEHRVVRAYIRSGVPLVV
jgi:hypothetical protein